ncbi:MAG: sugar transferase [Clostridiales bacterium]|nr:sugar transferase [Clostridiales bacterium]
MNQQHGLPRTKPEKTVPARRRAYRVVKRALDFLLALALLPLAALPVGAAALFILLESGRPVFFVQQRPGLHGKLFRLYKLRTMISQTHRDGQPLGDAQRLTRAGRIIRKLSIDELPQLLNVLLGQMSFIGPRPLLPAYLPLYSAHQMRRHEVLPGISGWAQVNGRNQSSWEQKFDNDVWYVDHQSLWLDVRIFIKTIINVLRREGINAGEGQTMPPFTGNAPGTGKG